MLHFATSLRTAPHLAAAAALALTAFTATIAKDHHARAAEPELDISQMARTSDNVMVVKVNELLLDAETPQVEVKIIEQWKGKVAERPMLVAARNDDSEADGGPLSTEQWEKGETYIAFFTQLEDLGDKWFGFTFRGLAGKIKVAKAKIASMKEVVTSIEKLANLDDKTAKTNALKGWLTSKNPELRKFAFSELKLRSSQFDYAAVKPTVEAALKDKSPEFRNAALQVAIRTYNPRAEKSKLRDHGLLKLLIPALTDTEESIRETAWNALQTRTAKKLPFDPKADPKDRAEQAKAWAEWFATAAEEAEIFDGSEAD